MFNIFKANEENYGIVTEGGRFGKGILTLGLHECVCGAMSSSCDYMLNGKIVTNYLCVHYLAYHRSEVPEEELEKLAQLEGSEELLEEDKEKLNFMLKK